MLGRTLLLPLPLAALFACSDTASVTTSAFDLPVDFAHACEGEGATVPPENDESAADLNDTRMCPDLESGEEGDLFGVVLDRQPPRLVVLQLNPATGTRRFLDADFFTPGITGIPVGDAPFRVITAPDFSAFHVVSSNRIDRVVLEGFDGTTLAWSKTSTPLPATAIGAERIGSDLVVIPAAIAELWLEDLTTSNLRRLPMPGLVAAVSALEGRLLVTFRDRPVLSLYDPDGTLLSEVGLVPACRNGLDDDGDTLSDRLDPDCADHDDDDESTASGAPRRDLPPAKLDSFEGAAPCSNGFDDDGDGATDFPADLGCEGADDDGETRPACSNGLDDDLDGQTDLDDAFCYSPFQNREGQLPTDGPFHPTFIDGGAYGRFVYVLDERAVEIAVFAWDGSTLTRVDVNAADITPPPLETVPFSNLEADPTETLAVPAIRPPALAAQGKKNIELPDTSLYGLTSGRLRGEIWERLITPTDGVASIPLDASADLWRPGRCDSSSTTSCLQPALDDATWFAFGPNIDGRIQLIEAIRRGTPIHRLAQRTTNLGQRTHDLTAPRLTLRGRLINARGEPAEGLPFLGPALEELLTSKVDGVSPERQRRFGIWPPADLETSLTETWTVSYQGQIPETAADLGMLTSETTLTSPTSQFCEAGVSAGDLLQLTVPTTAISDDLVHALEITLEDGRTCPVKPIHTSIIEVEITEVGMDTLEFSPETARIRPSLPELDTDAIAAQSLPRRACELALDALDSTLGLSERLVETSAFAPSNLPPTFSFNVRGAAWIAVGTRSGFLHRQRWNRTENRCETDETLSPLLSGRISEIIDSVDNYTQCPPSADELRESVIESLAPASTRYFNPSFGLDIFRGCTRTGDTFAPIESQQDTTFTFTVTSPHQGSALTVPEPLLIPRVPTIDFRRQQVQLDSAAKRAVILQFRLGDPKVIATYK
jgi:hypothetical protein